MKVNFGNLNEYVEGMVMGTVVVCVRGQDVRQRCVEEKNGMM
jgi:hypothetical protein